jgi:hypothetical protein
MPWRPRPDDPFPFPTLGYLIAEWIEAHCVIPDGYRQGEPWVCTREQLTFLAHFYRLWPTAQPWPSPRNLMFYGGQLRRSQKWGKDPFGATITLAEALGPARFDGWDRDGQPVGAPYPTPYIPILGVSEDQTDNTYRPLLTMLTHPKSPLANEVDIDPGKTRIELPRVDGTIEPVTSSPTSRLGQRMSFAPMTEPHLWTKRNGGRDLGANVKRNIAGMDGRWLELTNAWDPSQDSEAQATAEGKEPGVYIDTVESHRVEDLSDDMGLRMELLRQYGTHALELGGWVNLDRIMAEIRAPRTLESHARRYFLNEIVVGLSDAVNATLWDQRARENDLKPREMVALGFDGSRSRDWTGIVASRIIDGRWVTLGRWDPSEYDDGTVPRPEVDAIMSAAFDAYDVRFLIGDPYRWQEYFDIWAARWPGRVVEFPTNVESKMDDAIVRTMEHLKAGHTHDGHPDLRAHARNAALANGGRRKPRPGEDQSVQPYYLKVVKKHDNDHIDLFVCGILAELGRGLAIENGALEGDGRVTLEGSLMA